MRSELFGNTIPQADLPSGSPDPLSGFTNGINDKTRSHTPPSHIANLPPESRTNVTKELQTFVDPDASLYDKIRTLFLFLFTNCKNGSDKTKCDEGVIVGHGFLWLSWLRFTNATEQTFPPLINVAECINMMTPEDAATISSELHFLFQLYTHCHRRNRDPKDVDILVGPGAITDILSAVDAVERTHEPFWSLDFKDDLHEHLTPAPDTLTGFLTIMRGCNHRCTYCIVPQTRGPEVSRSLESILHEARAIGLPFGQHALGEARAGVVRVVLDQALQALVVVPRHVGGDVDAALVLHVAARVVALLEKLVLLGRRIVLIYALRSLSSPCPARDRGSATRSDNQIIDRSSLVVG